MYRITFFKERSFIYLLSFSLIKGITQFSQRDLYFKYRPWETSNGSNIGKNTKKIYF